RRHTRSTRDWSSDVCSSDLPDSPHSSALASRSWLVPVAAPTCQPSPTLTAVRPGACLLSDTLPPLVRATPMSFLHNVPGFRRPSDRKSTRLNSSHERISYAV